MCGLGTIRPIVLGFVPCLALATVGFGQPPEATWVFDVVRLTSGTEFRGLILSESPTQMIFIAVKRQPGRPTVCLPTSFTLREIAQVTRLSKLEREQLARRIELLGNEPAVRESRLKQLDLKQIPWDQPKRDALEYKSDWFVLESDASEVIVRRAAVRLEEIFAAFGRFIAPRVTGAKPTTIRLMRSCEDYRNQLRREGRSFDNAGYFDPARNLIVCASDLGRLGEDMHGVRQKHEQLKAALDRDEAIFTKLYKGNELLRHIQPIRETRRRIDQAEKQNDSIFAQSTRSLFATLAHESFHAYVESGADLPPNVQLPRWLNEGLAQVFESAIVEGGELRLGHAEAARLLRIKELTRRHGLMPLADVLQSRPAQFQDDHAKRSSTAEQRYLSAWGLTMYLTFDRQVVGGREFSGYLSALAKGKDPLPAFSEWLGGNLADVESDWHQYLLSLQTDGKRASLIGGK